MNRRTDEIKRYWMNIFGETLQQFFGTENSHHRPTPPMHRRAKPRKKPEPDPPEKNRSRGFELGYKTNLSRRDVGQLRIRSR